MIWLDFILTAAALPMLLITGYLAILAVFSWSLTPPCVSKTYWRFEIVVPAHNEEQGIAQTVQSLLAMDYPTDLRRVLVVADNCTDSTAQRAAQAGASVLVRNDSSHKGKGYALAHAFKHSSSNRWADAVVIVDADSVVSANLLHAFSARLEQGALAIQAEYGVLNSRDSWRTRLMTIALALFHGVRSLGRERMQVSCGLRGNGMCFASKLLESVPYDAFSLVEDVEYGIRIAQAGYRVFYAHEAQVLGEMVSSGKAAQSQRHRWEEGRRQMVRQYAASLLANALARRNKVLFDLAADLLVPPLTMIVSLAALGTAASIALSSVIAHSWSLWTWSPTILFLGLYLVRGWWLSKTGLGGLLDLLFAPAFVMWKFTLRFRRNQKENEWVRTTREKKP